jgi:hypothetical protein
LQDGIPPWRDSAQILSKDEKLAAHKDFWRLIDALDSIV